MFSNLFVMLFFLLQDVKFVKMILKNTCFGSVWVIEQNNIENFEGKKWRILYTNSKLIVDLLWKSAVAARHDFMAKHLY